MATILTIFCKVSQKIKPLQNDKITLLFTGVGKSCSCREFLKFENMSLNSIRENTNSCSLFEFRTFDWLYIFVEEQMTF